MSLLSKMKFCLYKDFRQSDVGKRNCEEQKKLVDWVGYQWLTLFFGDLYFQCINFLVSFSFLGFIHAVRPQNISKNWHFLPPDTHTYMCVSGGKNCQFSVNVAYVLNQWFLGWKWFRNYYFAEESWKRVTFTVIYFLW